MAEIIKTSKQIEEVFYLMVMTIFRLDPESPENAKRVRFPWGSDLSNPNNSSAPMGKKDADTCYIYALPQDDSYNRNRDMKYIDCGGRDLVAVDEHTDVHYIAFVNYGPNAYECARDIRDGLFTDDIRRLLKRNNFALVNDVPAIKRVPELVDGEWWNRVDVTAVFNEYVRRENIIPAIEDISIGIPNKAGHGLSIGATHKEGGS